MSQPEPQSDGESGEDEEFPRIEDTIERMPRGDEIGEYLDN